MTTKAKAKTQRKTPAWKAQYKLKAKLADLAIERGMRMTGIQVTANLFAPANPRILIEQSDLVTQWLMYGKKPSQLRVVESNDMGAGIPADSGC